MAHTQPNILLINTDQHRYDCLSAAGHPVLSTPNLDEIAAEGARFQNAFTTCASCIAARRSFLTGCFPSTTGVVGYQDGVPINRPTLPELLADAGYETALVGRTMHQFPADASYGYATRILGSTYVRDDEYATFLDWQAPGVGGIHSMGLSCNGWTVKPWPLSEHLHPTYWTARRAVELLEDLAASSPAFFTISFYAPHPPLFPPAHYLDRYEAADIPAPHIGDWAAPPSTGPSMGRHASSRSGTCRALGFGVDSNHIDLPPELMKRTQAGYLGLINQIDDALYPVISEFKRRSRAAGRPWLICMMSDHGEMLGDHYFFRKAEPYQGSAAIPLLIQGSPDLDFAAGAEPSGVTCLEDLFPTFLELAEAPLPRNIDGVNLAPVLRGESEGVRELLHGEHSACYDDEQAYHMITDGRSKYIWRPTTGREQLFDLESDPYECREVIGPEVSAWRRRMVEVLQERPEGFVNDRDLVVGRPYDAAMPVQEEL